MAFNPIQPFGQSAARRVSTGGLSAYGSTPEEAERNLLEKIGMGALSTLSMAGNVLDLPGSMVRDVLVGENPFDQWTSPLQAENRATGGDVLRKVFGMRKNKETGFVPLSDPGEFGRDVARLGAEIVLDPLSYLTFGGAALTKSGKAAEKAGLLPFLKHAGLNRAGQHGRAMGIREARTSLGLQDVLNTTPDVKHYTNQLRDVVGGEDALKSLLAENERLGSTVGVGLPFGRAMAGSNLGPVGDIYNRSADWLGMTASKSAPVRALRSLFDQSVKSKVSPVEQEIAELATAYTKPGQQRAMRKSLDMRDPRASRFEMISGRDPEAILVTSQDAIYPEKVAEYARGSNFDVELSPVLQFGDRKYQIVTDGHHRLEAARQAGQQPRFHTGNIGEMSPEQAAYSYPTLSKLLQGELSPEDFAKQFKVGDNWRNVETGDAVNLPTSSLSGRSALEAEFARLFGKKITPDYNWETDPREIGRWKRDQGVLSEFEADQARVVADRAARQADPMEPIVREFKKDFPDFTDRLRRQGDHEIESLIDHDLMVDEFNRRVMGNDAWYNEGNKFTSEDLSALLQAPKKKAYQGRTLTQIAEEARREAVASGREVQDPNLFVPGDVVEALDKGNYGRVHEIGEHKSTVYFRNPDTGAEAFVRLSNNQLKRRWTGQTKEAQVYAQEVRSKVFDKVVKLTGETRDVNLAFRKILGTNDVPPEFGTAILQHADEMRDANAAMLQSLEDKGFNVTWLKNADEDYGIEHFPRFVNPRVAEQRGMQNAPSILPTKAGFMEARQIETRDLPEFVANQLHAGQKYRTENGAKNIQRDFDEWLNPNFKDPNGNVLGKEGHAKALSSFLKGTKAGELYTQDYLKNFLQYQQQAETLNATADAIHDVLRRHGKPIDALSGIPDGMISVDQALQVAGFDPINANKYFRTRHRVDASSLVVPEDLIPQLKGVMDIGKSPEWATSIGKTIDRFNAQFKKWVTLPFPGFAFRNHTSGQHMNLASGYVNGPTDLASYTSAYGRMFSLQKTARENPSALSSKDRELLRSMLAYNVVSPRGFEDIDLSSVAIKSRPADPIADVIPPGVSVPGVGDSGRTLWRKAKTRVAENPLGVKLPDNRVGDAAARAGRTVRTAAESITDSGATLNALVEWQNRGAMFAYLVEKKGWSPQAAAQKVTDLQLDYGAMSDFEKSVMRRAVPFYAFTRKIVPQLIETIREQPGGALAQTIRTTNQGGEDPSRPLPDYVAQTSAIPLGERKEGSQSFLTGFGFAHEVPLQYLGGGVRGAGVEALSQLNPLIKGPLEYFTGESFFQRGPLGGRDIDDLDPTVGRILTQIGLQDESPSGQAKPVLGSQLAENVIANSPASRTLTTLRMILDPRKHETTALFPGDSLAMNLLTGARVSDVTPASQDALVRDTIQAMVKSEGGRSFETARFSNKIIERAEESSPQQAERMRAFNAYLNLLAKRARERAKERAAKQ